MPTDKRERQRAGRDARRQAAREAQRRAARRRQVIGAMVLLIAVVGIGLGISLTGSDDASAKKVDAGSPGTTTAGEDGETDADEDDEQAVSDVPCPPTDGSAEPRKAFGSAPPPMCLGDGVESAEIETDVGSFTIDLFEEKAPRTVNNFVFLARYRAYEDVPFHRVIPDFVVQGGDIESGTGTGGPGYKFPDELPKKGEYEIGSVAMANSGPDTNGSQFFVITGDQGVSLPPSYSLFGKVTQGLDVVKKIEADGDPSGTPKVVHKIVKVTIIEKE